MTGMTYMAGQLQSAIFASSIRDADSLLEHLSACACILIVGRGPSIRYKQVVQFSTISCRDTCLREYHLVAHCVKSICFGGGQMMKKHKLKSIRIDGGTPADKRHGMVTAFQVCTFGLRVGHRQNLRAHVQTLYQLGQTFTVCAPCQHGLSRVL